MTTDTTDDLNLVNRAILGDMQAWNEIISTYHLEMLKSVRFGISSLSYDREDLVQECWMSLFTQSLINYSGAVPLNWWLKQELSATYSDVLKKARAQRRIPAEAMFDRETNEEVDMLSNLIDESDTPEQVMIWKDEAELDAAMQSGQVNHLAEQFRNLGLI